MVKQLADEIVLVSEYELSRHRLCMVCLCREVGRGWGVGLAAILSNKVEEARHW